MSVSPPPGVPDRRRPRGLLLGVALGVLVPAGSFALVLVAVRGPGDAGTITSVGSWVWALLAFAGVVMLAFDRTRQVGLGILLGFCGVVLAGAGTCTAVVMGGGL